MPARDQIVRIRLRVLREPVIAIRSLRLPDEQPDHVGAAVTSGRIVGQDLAADAVHGPAQRVRFLQNLDGLVEPGGADLMDVVVDLTGQTQPAFADFLAGAGQRVPPVRIDAERIEPCCT